MIEVTNVTKEEYLNCNFEIKYEFLWTKLLKKIDLKILAMGLLDLLGLENKMSDVQVYVQKGSSLVARR